MGDPLQSSLRFAPWVDPLTRRLPGVVPVTPADWLLIDDAYAGQMGLRDALLAGRRDRVVALDPTARHEADELLDMVLQALDAPGAEQVRRADGVTVTVDRGDPMGTLCRLVAEDLCLMVRPGDAHVLAGAALCFPAGWRLDEKFGRPMVAIHGPVARYDADIARRVQRLLDGVQPGRGLLRGTAHWSGSSLHNPLSEADRSAPPAETPYIRVERQCLFRLPHTRAVVFSIHTSLIRPDALSPAQAAALAAHPIRRSA